jgi:hypothetical protein
MRTWLKELDMPDGATASTLHVKIQSRVVPFVLFDGYVATVGRLLIKADES